MPTYVADASALLAYLRDERGADAVDEILADRSNACFAHAFNVCEVYYATLRAEGLMVAIGAVAKLRSDGIEIREDMNDAFWMDIGALKVSPGGLSLADCAGIALARLESCEFLTTDHHEMDKLVGTGTVALRFIR